SGTGLGLSICHRIVTSLGGAITVDSQVGRGSTFRVHLPLAELEAEAPPAPAPHRPARRGKILVVDDEPYITSPLARPLARDHEGVGLGRAEDALARIAAGDRFDVILCDLMMPHMTGMDLHGELMRSAPDQAERMIFMTGGAFTPTARAFLDATPNRRIEKPFDPVQLAGLIQDRLR